MDEVQDPIAVSPDVVALAERLTALENAYANPLVTPVDISTLQVRVSKLENAVFVPKAVA